MARTSDGQGSTPVRAGGNWKKLQKVRSGAQKKKRTAYCSGQTADIDAHTPQTLVPESERASKRRRRTGSSSYSASADKGKGRAGALAANGNGGESRSSSSSPAPSSLPWFAEDLSPEDLALVRTNSGGDESRLRDVQRPGALALSASTSRNVLAAPAEDAESERRKRAILGGGDPAGKGDGGAASSSEKAEPGTYIAIDCEMVGVGLKGSESILARVSIVNWHGAVLLDTFVRPQEMVTDYRTWVSGVRPEDLRGAPSFGNVQQQVADLIKGRVLVGHAIQNDLSALLLSHPRPLIRDTATFQGCRDLAKTKHPSLRKLVALKLGIDIQKRGDAHSSVEDARATMALYRTVHADWQRSLVAGGKGAGPAAATKSGKLRAFATSPTASSAGAQVLYPGWKKKQRQKHIASSDGAAQTTQANGGAAGRQATQESKRGRGSKRSAVPDDPEWWSKV